jgi:hypothetical protein
MIVQHATGLSPIGDGLGMHINSARRLGSDRLQLCQLLGRDAQRPGRGAGTSGPRAQSVLRPLRRGRRPGHRGGSCPRDCSSTSCIGGPARPTLHGEARSRATPRRAQSAHQRAALCHHDRGAGNLGAARARASGWSHCPSGLRALCWIQLFRPRAPLATPSRQRPRVRRLLATTRATSSS